MQGNRCVHKIVVCLLCWLVSVSLEAQLPQALKITNFDGSTGFYSRVVTSVLKDANGFLWIGSSDGLYRYDGYSFRNYRKQPADTNSLSDNSITQLALGKDNTIWMGLQKGGVSKYDPATGKFTNYPLQHNGKQITGAVTMLLVDHAGQVWLGIRQKGFWQLDTQTGSYTNYDVVNDKDAFVPKDLSQSFNTVSTGIEGQPGILWLGTFNGLYRFNTATKTLQAIRNKPLEQNVFRDDDFITICLDGETLWLGSWAGGMTSYHIRTQQWKNYKINLQETQKYTTNIISGIRIKSANELWITSNDKGLGVFDKQKEQFSFYSSDPVYKTEIPTYLCYEVETDKNNDLWLIHEWGLTRIQSQQQQFIFTNVPVTKTDNKDFYYVRDRVEDDERIYIGTTLADGLQVIDKRTGQKKQFPVQVMKGEEPFLAVYRLFKDSKGTIWIVSRDYIYWYDTKLEKPVLADQPPVYPLQNGSNQYANITEDKAGNIWISSARNGVFRYDDVRHNYTHFYKGADRANSISSNAIPAITTDKEGRVWIGGPEGCFAYFDPAQQKFIGLSATAARNIPVDHHIVSLLCDKNDHIWAGTDEGLLDMQLVKNKPVVHKIYTTQDGLRGDLAYATIEDADGKIWCMTPSALCMIDPATQRVSSVALQNNMIRGITGRVYLATSSDKVHVLTYGGYYSFDPGQFQDKQRDSTITITSFRVKDKEYYYGEELKKEGRIELGPYENLFTFEFAVLDFKQSDDQQYAYMLEGFDKEWVIAGNRRYASYTNIPGGNYVFKVKTLNVYGGSNTAVLSIPLYVATPFYNTWWFLSLLAVVVATGLYLFYRFRLAKQSQILILQTKAQALEKEKTQVQYENLKQHLNPHFLFNSLTSLGSLIRADQKLAGNFLDGMSRIYRYILQSKDNEMVPLKEEIKFIQSFIQLQKTRFEEGLEVIINVAEEHQYSKIVPVTLQNLLENAIKHNIIDSESPLVIDIFVEDEYLLVRNNLQKKKFVETSNKQGLDNLFSLYKYLSGKPMLVEETDQTFTVKIPLL